MISFILIIGLLLVIGIIVVLLIKIIKKKCIEENNDKENIEEYKIDYEKSVKEYEILKKYRNILNFILK